jgi:hypothetical protein
MEQVVQNESNVEVANWQMDVEEFNANGCLINGD